MVSFNKLESFKTPIASGESHASSFAAGIKQKITLSDEQKERISNEFTFYGNLTSEVINFGSQIYYAYQAGAPFPGKLLATIKLVEDFVNKFLEEHPNIYKAIQASPLVSLASLPSSIYNIGSLVRDFCKGETTNKIEPALDVIYELGTCGTILSEAASVMSALGRVAESSIAWANPLSIASTGMFIAKPLKTGYKWWQNSKTEAEARSAKVSFFSHSAEFLSYCFYLIPSLMPLGDGLWSLSELIEEGGLWHQNHELLKKFKAGENKVKDLQNAVEHILSKDDEYLKEQFKVSGEKLKLTAAKVSRMAKAKLNSGNPTKMQEGEKELKEFVETLQNRIQDKQFTHKLGSVAGVVNIIGAGVLLAPQFAPIGYGIRMVGSGITIGKLVYAKRIESQFENFINSRCEDKHQADEKHNPYQAVLTELNQKALHLSKRLNAKTQRAQCKSERPFRSQT